MKKFTKLAALSMSLLLAIGMCALTACGDDKTSESSKETSSTSVSSEETKEYTCYEFVVKNADGTKVGEGYKINLCEAEGTQCYSLIDVINGVCVYNEAVITKAGVYKVQVLDPNYQIVKTVYTTEADNFSEIVITLD